MYILAIDMSLNTKNKLNGQRDLHFILKEECHDTDILFSDVKI